MKSQKRLLHKALGFLLTCFTIFSLTAQASLSSETHVLENINSQVYLPIVVHALAPIIPNTTKILTEDINQSLVSISDDNGVLTFAQTNPDLAALKAGDIIASEVTELTPNGLLRQVTNISTVGDQLIVTTIPSTIENAVQQGTISINHHKLSPDDVQSQNSLPGVTLLNSGLTTENNFKSNEDVFFIEMDDVILVDLDDDPSTIDDQIKAKGTIEFSTEVDFNLTVQNNKLQNLYFVQNMNEVANLEIFAGIDEPVITKEREIAHYYLDKNPIVVSIGVFPVVIIPKLSIVVGIDGSVHVGVTTGVSQNASLSAGLKYADKSWHPIADFSNSFEYHLPSLSTGIEIKGYAGAKLELLFYRVAGPSAEIDLGLKLEADLFTTPWWKLYGILEVPVGVSIEVLGRSIVDYQEVVISYKKLLAEAGTNNGMTTLVSKASDGTQGNGWTESPSISADGRYIAFSSDSNNLVPFDVDNVQDIFVHDRLIGQTKIVSIASDGTQGNSNSWHPSISSNGRYVAFTSAADNLVNDDINLHPDVFIHDQVTGITKRVSIASDGTQAHGDSGSPDISEDGRYIAFVSSANNLTPDPGNLYGGDVYVHDQLLGQTILVSATLDGRQSDSGYAPSISADGQFITFYSFANNLTLNDVNGWDVFLYSQTTNDIVKVSTALDGTLANGPSTEPSISGNGRFIAFYSEATNLVSGDNNNLEDIFVFDRLLNTTKLVSINSVGAQANRPSYFPKISDNGQYIAFITAASNLSNADTNGYADVYVYDQINKETNLISVNSDGIQGNEGSWSSFTPAISATGRFIAFSSMSTNLISNDLNGGLPDIFLRERLSYMSNIGELIIYEASQAAKVCCT